MLSVIIETSVHYHVSFNMTPTRVHLPSHVKFNAWISFKGHLIFIVSLNVLLIPWMIFLSMIFSVGLTPFKSDFFDYVKCRIFVQDISNVNEVIGIGTTIDTKGQFVYFHKWFIIIPGSPFQSSSLSSELWRKEHYFWISNWESPHQLEQDRHSYWCFWV